MLSNLALLAVVLTGLYLICLAVVSLIAPARASQFLMGFADSAFAHYLELLLRLVVGAAFLQYAPEMAFSAAFTGFGWVLILTTLCLFAIPWQWHRRFAQKTVPQAVRNLNLIAVAALAAGSAVLLAVAAPQIA